MHRQARCHPATLPRFLEFLFKHAHNAMRMIQLVFDSLAWMSLQEERWPDAASFSPYLAKEH
jgi:hypothetical protein